MSALIAIALVWGFTIPSWLHVIAFLVAWVAVDYIFLLFERKGRGSMYLMYSEDYESVMNLYYDGLIDHQEWYRRYNQVMYSEHLFMCRG